MCSATDSYDIALTMDNNDAVHEVFDGTPIEHNIQKRLIIVNHLLSMTLNSLQTL